MKEIAGTATWIEQLCSFMQDATGWLPTCCQNRHLTSGAKPEHFHPAAALGEGWVEEGSGLILYICVMLTCI